MSVSTYPYLNPASLLVAGNIPSTCFPAVTACATHSSCTAWDQPGNSGSCQAPLPPDQKAFLLCQMAITHSPRSCPVALHRSQSRAQAAFPALLSQSSSPQGTAQPHPNTSLLQCHQPEPGTKPLCSHPPDPAQPAIPRHTALASSCRELSGNVAENSLKHSEPALTQLPPPDNQKLQPDVSLPVSPPVPELSGV